jgi:SNF2 family DNA or RNA helicase
MKYTFKRKPHGYQLRALQKALTQDATPIIFDPGLGKTKVAIDFAAIKYLKEGVKKVAIICPLSAMGVWDDEWYLDCPDDISYSIIPLVGKMPERLKLLKEVAPKNEPQVVILTFDTAKNEDILKLLLRYYRELLVVDELHFCKSITAQRTKAVTRLSRVTRYRLGLTGTLIPKDPLDVIAQYNLLTPSVFGDLKTKQDWWKVARHYADFHPEFKSKPIRWHNMTELQEKILSIAARAKDTENANLPPLIIRDIPVLLGPGSKKVYKQMAEEAIADMEENKIDASTAAVKAMKLHQITGGFLQQTQITGLDERDRPIKETKIYSVGEQEKLEVFKDLITQQLEQSHKVIVACAFLAEISTISAWMNTQKIEYRVIKGGVSGEDRAQAKRDFQTDSKLKVIIFQISAATSMTLTAGDVGILYSCTHKWDDYFQWLKRLHRDGTKHESVTIYRLIAKGTIDRKIIQAVETKQDFTDVLVDKRSYRKMLTPDF